MTHNGQQIKPKAAQLKKKANQNLVEYYELIGLSKEPFSMAPDPDFFYSNKGSWRMSQPPGDFFYG